VYAAGVVQGIGWSRPAASAVFTSPTDYGLSSTEYGGMFLPQAILAIVASLAGAGLRKPARHQAIYLLGLLANLLAMTLLVVSGLRCGTIPRPTDPACVHDLHGHRLRLHRAALNTFAAAFFPQTVDKAVLALNACSAWARRWRRSSSRFLSASDLVGLAMLVAC